MTSKQQTLQMEREYRLQRALARWTDDELEAEIREMGPYSIRAYAELRWRKHERMMLERFGEEPF